jgi:hypothetical protein
MTIARRLKNIPLNLKKLIKRKVIKIVYLEEIYPNLTKYNLVPSETIEVPEANCSTIATPLAYTTILEGALYWSDYSIILTKDRKIISESLNVNRPIDTFNLKTLLNLKTEKIPGFCTIFHQWTNNYYHTLIDNIPRFYLSCQQEFIQHRTEEIKLIHGRHISESEKFFLQPLMPKNFKLLSVERGKIYYIDKLIFSNFLSPKNCGFISKFYREEIYSRFMPQRSRKKEYRIFISRVSAYNGRHILNEEELLNVLKEFGFQRYILESMPLSDQIELFYDAEAVVASHGAGLTNLIFSEKAKVLELFPSQFFSLHYYSLAQSMGHTYQHWHGNEKTLNSNFSVNVPQVKILLERLLSS